MTNDPPPISEEELTRLRKRFAFDGVTMVVPRAVPEEFRSYAGEAFPLNTTALRSVVWLSENEVAPFGIPLEGSNLVHPGQEDSEVDGAALVIANVFHEDRFWIGLVRPADVEHVFMQQEVFLKLEATGQPLAAHGQLRFLMREGTGIHLFAQEEGQPAFDGEPLNDFIASAEAIGPAIEGFPSYDLVGGTKGWYRQALRFLSLEAKAPQMLEREHNINQYLLRLRGIEKRAVLVETVRRSNEMGLTVPYNTLAIGGTQCVFEAFNILDRAVLSHRKRKSLRMWVSRLFDRVPIFVANYHDARG